MPEESPDDVAVAASPIGRRIAVIGNTSSGKSTLGERLARLLDVSFVEMDAINWQPNWVSLVEIDPEEFERRLGEATSGDGWVTAGSYRSFAQRVFWPRLETVIWLDPPLWRLIWRVLSRSWRRWRSKELLWGTNYERFFPQLAIWRKADSLVWWAVTQRRKKRDEYLAAMADPQWAHIRFVRLRSLEEVELFLEGVRQALPGADS
ncbi:MAG: hypothetical protein HN712_12160 [Gemmatimonadetes bacterium]|mgnify:CR=1 FL=1|jgi:adenylate kinase family enzyme|nr:hypothetical protein [Gemmatimonadota bacterium]MBT6150070.1 hypothetical protein [Gemmatimonadota bacterium]MBT7861064.1 hypothetical protein [Gemmatimonadota bacterium]